VLLLLLTLSTAFNHFLGGNQKRSVIKSLGIAITAVVALALISLGVVAFLSRQKKDEEREKF